MKKKKVIKVLSIVGILLIICGMMALVINHNLQKKESYKVQQMSISEVEYVEEKSIPCVTSQIELVDFPLKEYQYIYGEDGVLSIKDQSGNLVATLLYDKDTCSIDVQ